jgi:hypothetical protein
MTAMERDVVLVFQDINLSGRIELSLRLERVWIWVDGRVVENVA